MWMIMTLAFISTPISIFYTRSHTLFDTRSINNMLILFWSMEVYHLMPVIFFSSDFPRSYQAEQVHNVYCMKK